MIIDGHSHACGRYLTAEGIVKALDDSRVDKVVLVPGELKSRSEYSLPDIASNKLLFGTDTPYGANYNIKKT